MQNDVNRIGRTVDTALTALAAALLVIAAAIAAPILLRGFYYAQIGSLQLEARTGYSVGVIRAAYDEMMDYLVLGTPFGTGQLAYSAAGESHFADCRVLFLLDFWVAGISAAYLVLRAAFGGWRRRRGVRPAARRHLPVFWSAVGSIGIFAALGVWGAVDFYSFFVAFHAAFFPGKTNWVFDPVQDQIINILPERFFLHCAALIAGLILAANIVFLVADAVWRRQNRGF